MLLSVLISLVDRSRWRRRYEERGGDGGRETGALSSLFISVDFFHRGVSFRYLSTYLSYILLKKHSFGKGVFTSSRCFLLGSVQSSRPNIKRCAGFFPFIRFHHAGMLSKDCVNVTGHVFGQEHRWIKSRSCLCVKLRSTQIIHDENHIIPTLPYPDPDSPTTHSSPQRPAQQRRYAPAPDHWDRGP